MTQTKIPPRLDSSDQRLIQRIVNRVFIRYTPGGSDGRALTREELFHYGVIGLLEAQKNYDSEKGVAWEVFAAFRIEGEMLDHIRKAPLIRLPQKIQEQVREIRKAGKELEQQGLPATSVTIARKLGCTPDKVSEHLALVPTLSPLAEECDPDNVENGNPGVILADDAETDPHDTLLRQELWRILRHCLEHLPEARDRIIVKARKLEDITLRELSKSFDCSIESIRKREKTALLQLRECLQRHGWQAAPK
ncbi:MAG: sigma-70 family RNA polymerase sigma factor [Deltaproteobacteria bacterium]|nr:sigma-70 family RNA polymerase sigma factor [Deltaproteobacteria bacterium]